MTRVRSRGGYPLKSNLSAIPYLRLAQLQPGKTWMSCDALTGTEQGISQSRQPVQTSPLQRTALSVFAVTSPAPIKTAAVLAKAPTAVSPWRPTSFAP